ncbi:MAG: DMT family transporter [Clostridium sp.]|nr:DMT family transporter [Clostridium sp.]
MLFYILISILTGVIIVVSRIFNTKLSHEIGLIESSYYNYFTAAITSVIMFFFIGEAFSLTSFNGIPAYAYLGGFMGVLIVILNSVVTPKLPAFNVTLLIFIAQLFTGIAIDWIISGAVPINKISGGLLVVLGLSYNLYVDRCDEKEDLSLASEI